MTLPTFDSAPTPEYRDLEEFAALMDELRFSISTRAALYELYDKPSPNNLKIAHTITPIPGMSLFKVISTTTPGPVHIGPDTILRALRYAAASKRTREGK